MRMRNDSRSRHADLLKRGSRMTRASLNPPRSGEPVREEQAIGQDVSQLVPYTLRFAVRTPLEALEQFGCFDGDALREVLRCVELLPFALRHEGAKRVEGAVRWHALQ